jgi:hypothetical protein
MGRCWSHARRGRRDTIRALNPLLRTAASAALLTISGCASGATRTSDTESPARPSAATSRVGAHRGRRVTRERGDLLRVTGARDLAGAATLNLRDRQGRAILAFGPSCRVQVPASVPADEMHADYDYEEVDCPIDYDDPAWDDCPTTLLKDAKGCFCRAEDNDSSPLPTIVTCPAVTQ